MRRLALATVALLSLAGLLGCGEDEPRMSNSQRFAVAHEAELRTFRDRLNAATAAAAGAPELKGDGFMEAVTLDTREYRSGHPESGNTRTWQLDLLQASDARPAVRLGSNLNDLRAIDRWLADTSALAPGTSEMERLLSLEYVLVLRILRAQAPEQAGDESFRGGGVAAEALLYRLSDGAALGGVRFGSLSSGSIQVHGAAATSMGLDRDISLRADLSVQAHRSLGRAIEAALPGTVQDLRYQTPEPAPR